MKCESCKYYHPLAPMSGMCHCDRSQWFETVKMSWQQCRQFQEGKYSDSQRILNAASGTGH